MIHKKPSQNNREISAWLVGQGIDLIRTIKQYKSRIMYEDEMADGVVALVVLTGYKVESYKTFIGIWELSKIKSLYWD